MGGIEHNIRLDLGCGNAKTKDDEGEWLGIDKSQNSDADIIRDFEKHGLPFCDNSVSAIRVLSVLEHIHDLIFVMNECHRVLKKGKEMFICVPVYTAENAYKDPTHVRFFTSKTFSYFEKPKKGNGKAKLYGAKYWKALNLEQNENGCYYVRMTPEK